MQPTIESYAESILHVFKRNSDVVGRKWATYQSINKCCDEQ